MVAPCLGAQRNGSAQQNPCLEIKLSWDGSLPVGGLLWGSWWDWGGGEDGAVGMQEVEMA